MNPDLPFAFLITSFADDEKFQSVRHGGIDPAAAAFGYPVYRIDEIPTDSPIVEATRHYISLADFVIADLSGARPNCYYEVGYATPQVGPSFVSTKASSPHLTSRDSRSLAIAAVALFAENSNPTCSRTC
ncbi:MAG: hypothetical protein U0132_02095 [Gemmatimonadaceae bacterium]